MLRVLCCPDSKNRHNCFSGSLPGLKGRAFSVSPTLLTVPRGHQNLPIQHPCCPGSFVLSPHTPELASPAPPLLARRVQLRVTPTLMTLAPSIRPFVPTSMPWCQCKLPWKGENSAPTRITSSGLPSCSVVWSHSASLCYM